MTAIAGAAVAADMPTKAPPVVPPVPFVWTGCYAGLHVGAAHGQNDYGSSDGFHPAASVPLLVGSSVTLDQPVSGLLDGGQVGCRYELAPHWVVGIGGDFSSAHIVDARTPVLVIDPVARVPTTFNAQTDWLATATGSLGYVFDGVLVYVKGGAAWAHDRYAISTAAEPFVPAAATNFLASETRSGWTAGIGLEYPFHPNFTASFEYDYYDLGHDRVHFVDAVAGSPGNLDVTQRIQAIKFGLNYYFWDAPGLGASSGPMAAAGPAPALLSAFKWTQTFSTETRYFTWQSTRGYPTNGIVLGPVNQPNTAQGHGFELYIPYAAQLVGLSNDWKVELLGRGGWVEARQSTAGLTGSVETATDTVANATFTYIGLKGVLPFVGVSLNLPTGLASLGPNQVNARMDPDLVDIASFGEGFNVGPTLGVSVPINNNLMVTGSIGYTLRGAYEREGTLTPLAPDAFVQPVRIQPGNNATVTGSIGYDAAPYSATLTASIAQETATLQDGVPFVKPGLQYTLSGTTSYRWEGDHSGVSTATIGVSHSNRNEVMFECLTGCPTTLTPEPFNTNSNIYRIGFEHLFPFDRVAFGPTASFLYRDHNGYEPTTLQFVPAKERYALGMQARYAPNDIVMFNARLEHVWTQEETNPALPGNEQFSVLENSTAAAFAVPVVSSTGWQVALGATAKF